VIVPDIYWAVSSRRISSEILWSDLLADGLELMFVGIGLICVPIAVILYTRINAHREKIIEELAEKGEKDTKYTKEVIRRLGDRAPEFRYTI
jgi:hypothetical protein